MLAPEAPQPQHGQQQRRRVQEDALARREQETPGADQHVLDHDVADLLVACGGDRAETNVVVEQQHDHARQEPQGRMQERAGELPRNPAVLDGQHQQCAGQAEGIDVLGVEEHPRPQPGGHGRAPIEASGKLRYLKKETGESDDLDDLGEGVARVDPQDASRREQDGGETRHRARSPVPETKLEEQPRGQRAHEPAREVAGKHVEKVRGLGNRGHATERGSHHRAGQVGQRRQQRLGRVELAAPAGRRIGRPARLHRYPVATDHRQRDLVDRARVAPRHFPAHGREVQAADCDEEIQPGMTA